MELEFRDYVMAFREQPFLWLVVFFELLLVCYLIWSLNRPIQEKPLKADYIADEDW